MKLQFKCQQFQADAAKAVVEVFVGQTYAVQNYLIDSGIDRNGQAEEFFAENFLGAANAKIILSDEKILQVDLTTIRAILRMFEIIRPDLETAKKKTRPRRFKTFIARFIFFHVIIPSEVRFGRNTTAIKYGKE